MTGLQDAWLAAWKFAAAAHRNQKIPGQDLPYVVHLGAVAMEVMVAHQQVEFKRPVLALQCALLHDVLEDTDADESGIVLKFGPDVTAGVRALTKHAALMKSDAMADSLQRIQLQPFEVWAVKLADRITNLGPPPPHWTETKIASYRSEAQVILDALRESHEPLALRLADRILRYPPSRD